MSREGYKTISISVSDFEKIRAISIKKKYSLMQALSEAVALLWEREYGKGTKEEPEKEEVKSDSTALNECDDSEEDFSEITTGESGGGMDEEELFRWMNETVERWKAEDAAKEEAWKAQPDISNREAVREIKRVLYRMIAENFRMTKEDVEDPDCQYDLYSFNNLRIRFPERYKDYWESLSEKK